MGLILNPYRFSAAAGGNFFGIDMWVELWAEDPSWSNPGDGNDITTSLRNNGANDDVYGPVSASNYPKYRSTGLGGSYPSFDFNATSATNGGYFLSSVTNPTPSLSGGALSVVIVGQVDAYDGSSGAYFCDRYNSGGGGDFCIVGIGADLPLTTFQAYTTGTLKVNSGNTWDTSVHLHIAVFKDNDLRYYIDGTLEGTDSSGTVNIPDQFVIGRVKGLSASQLRGDLGYFAVYDGDITADGNYSTFVTDIKDHYGIT